jgi:ABC-type phosphate transport system permease subunit
MAAAVIAASAAVILIANAYILITGSSLALGRFGLNFLTSSSWNSVEEKFSASYLTFWELWLPPELLFSSVYL